MDAACPCSGNFGCMPLGPACLMWWHMNFGSTSHHSTSLHTIDSNAGFLRLPPYFPPAGAEPAAPALVAQQGWQFEATEAACSTHAPATYAVYSYLPRANTHRLLALVLQVIPAGLPRCYNYPLRKHIALLHRVCTTTQQHAVRIASMHGQRLPASCGGRACSRQHVASIRIQATARTGGYRPALGRVLDAYQGRCLLQRSGCPQLCQGLHVPHALPATATTTVDTANQECVVVDSPGQEASRAYNHYQAESTPGAAEQVSAGSEAYSWTSYWWPIQAIENLNPKVPLHVDLLGLSLVVWGDSQGNWHCLEDKCPHRLAPLSEGRVEKDNIMCCYHGWTFSGSGQCTGIPQLASDPKAHDNACSSKRSCAVPYPTKVHNGLLWIWPEAGPEAAQRAAKQEPIGMASKGHNNWFIRDLPLRFDTLVENVMDASHVPHAHHGVQGSRYEVINHWNKISLHGEATSQQGWFVTADAPAKLLAGSKWSCHFHPPYEVVYHVDGQIMGPQAAMVPLKPGWTRMITNANMQNKALLKRIPLLARLLFSMRLKNVARSHQRGTNAVLDGDTYLLHVAERNLPAKDGIGASTVASRYYSPSTADTPVVSWRRWLQQFGPPPTCRPTDIQPPLMSKEEVLNRYEQHTKHCSYCLKALASLDKQLSVTTFLGLAAAVASVAQAVAAAALAHVTPLTVTTSQSAVPAALAGWWGAVQSTGMHLPLLGCAVLALTCLMLYRRLADYRQKFFYEDYVHATKH